jgi:hypothetical protein
MEEDCEGGQGLTKDCGAKGRRKRRRRKKFSKNTPSDISKD